MKILALIIDPDLIRRILQHLDKTSATRFLLEAALLSGMGGLCGVLLAASLGVVLSLFARGFSAQPPLWATLAGLLASVSVGIAAGYWPARRAAGMDPVEALRHE